MPIKKIIMKKILYLFVFLSISLSVKVNAQAVVVGSIEYTSPTQISVKYNNTGTITGNSISSITVWIRLLNTNVANTSLSIGTNPFNLNSSGSSNVLSDAVYRFQALTTLSNPNSVFPTGVDVLIANFSISGTTIPIVAELVVAVQPSSGTSLGIDNTSNALIWPGGSGIRAIDTALPIRLVGSSAEKFGNNNSLLKWNSLAEENASHFDIEKSLDAENWVKAGTEKTRGSLNYGAEYSFVDENAVTLRNDENTVYYRLKMVDNDGSFQYSDIRLVTFERSLTDVEVYPNPSHEFFNWKMGVGDTQVHDAQLQLFDMTGKLVKKQTVSANGISKVDIAELETGLYNIVVKHEDQIYRKRIIKTN